MADAFQPGNTAENTDPRVLRSRQMLMEALLRLLTHKEFDDISIQEIADEATLNRATFYLHYADKNALLQAMTESRFRNLIERRRAFAGAPYATLPSDATVWAYSRGEVTCVLNMSDEAAQHGGVELAPWEGRIL